MSFRDERRGGLAAMARHVARARAHDVPVGLIGVGIGPLDVDDGRALVHFIANESAFVSVRDDASAELLRACGYTDEIVVGADPVVLLMPPEPDAGRRWREQRGVGDYIAVSLRAIPQGPADLADPTAALLDAIVERTGLRVVSVPFQWQPPKDVDLVAHRDVERRMKHAEALAHLDTMHRDLALSLIAGARAVLAMRLHASIVANAAGVPSVGLAYDPKISAYYAEMGREHLALSLDAGPGALLEVVSDVLDHHEAHAYALAQPMERLRVRASDMLERLAASIPASAARPPASPAERERRLEAMYARIDDEIASARRARA